jgi:class 3 adenylate cyclase
MLVVALLFAGLAGDVDVASLDPPTDIGGQWRCTAGDDVSFRSAAFDDSSWRQAHFPDGDGPLEKACAGDFMWLRKRITVAPHLRDQPLGVAVGLVDGAYEVFVDGVLVGGDGDIDDRVYPPHRGQAFAVPRAVVEDGVVVIALRVRTEAPLFDVDPGRRIIPSGPMLVGLMPSVDNRAASAVEATIAQRALGFLAMSLVFSFIALYHILLWFLRPTLKGYLWFGITCILVTSWLAVTELRSTAYIPLDPVTAGIVGNVFGTLVNAAFIEFLWRFVKNTTPTRPWRIYQGCLVVVAFIGLVPVVGLQLTVLPPVILLKIAMPIAGLTRLLTWGVRSHQVRALIVGFVIGAIAAPAQVYLVKTGVQLPVSPGEVSFLCFMVVMAVALAAQFTQTLTDVDAKNAELRETNASIARFVPFGFLDALGRQSVNEVKRGDGRAREMAVMFCDIRGFTTMTEALGPEQTFALINDYLARMEPEIYKGSGFINQYLGDGIMALFPTGDRSGADGGVVAAIGMCRALERLNQERASRGEAPLRIGIGLHTGPLMIGTIGGGEQLDGGVIGDCVNAAARLEGMTKMYAAQLLVSGDVVQKLEKSRPTLRHLDTVRAKGKTEALAIYEVLDVDPHQARKAATLERFTEAQRQYRAGSFEAALRGFEGIMADPPEDGAARLLRERCHQLMLYPPKDWDGVYSLSSK